MFFKNKAKASLRSKIVSIFLDNYTLLNNGTEPDEWGNDWKEKSFNESIQFFKDFSQNSNMKLFAKFGLVALKIPSLVENIDNLNIYDTYNVLHHIYFDEPVNAPEKDKLKDEFIYESAKRGLKIEMI